MNLDNFKGKKYDAKDIEKYLAENNISKEEAYKYFFLTHFDIIKEIFNNEENLNKYIEENNLKYLGTETKMWKVRNLEWGYKESVNWY
jgi:hypothetical protein